MRYIVLLIALPLLSNAQHLTKDQKDAFTGAVIKETSWSVLSRKAFYAYYARTRKVDDRIYVQVSVMMSSPSAYIITEDDPLMLKLSNDSVVELYTKEVVLPCNGCGTTDGWMGARGWGSKASYYVPLEKAKQIRSNDLQGIRVYTSEGYFEAEIKPKNSQILKEGMKLVM